MVATPMVNVYHSCLKVRKLCKINDLYDLVPSLEVKTAHGTSVSAMYLGTTYCWRQRESFSTFMNFLAKQELQLEDKCNWFCNFYSWFFFFFPEIYIPSFRTSLSGKFIFPWKVRIPCQVPWDKWVYPVDLLVMSQVLLVFVKNDQHFLPCVKLVVL